MKQPSITLDILYKDMQGNFKELFDKQEAMSQEIASLKTAANLRDQFCVRTHDKIDASVADLYSRANSNKNGINGLTKDTAVEKTKISQTVVVIATLASVATFVMSLIIFFTKV